MVAPVTVLAVTIVTAIAVIAPFAMKRMGELPFDASDIEKVSGRPGRRRSRAVMIMATIAVLGAYAAWAQASPWWYVFGLFAILMTALAVVAIMPSGPRRAVWMRVIEYSLVAFGLYIIASCLGELWTAAVEGRTHMLSRRRFQRTIVVTLQNDPGRFWSSVLACAIFTSAALFALKEYFLRVRERHLGRGASAAPDEPAPEAAPSRVSAPAAPAEALVEHERRGSTRVTPP